MNGGPASAQPKTACTMALHSTITAFRRSGGEKLKASIDGERLRRSIHEMLAQAHERNDENKLQGRREIVDELNCGQVEAQ